MLSCAGLSEGVELDTSHASVVLEQSYFDGTPQDILDALWKLIGPITKSTVTFLISKLVNVTVGGQVELRTEALDIMEKIISRYSGQFMIVGPFWLLLRDGDLETLEEILRLAENKLSVDTIDAMSCSSETVSDESMSDVPVIEGTGH